MNYVDVIIVVILLVIVCLIVYFSFIKDRGNPCKGCPYYKGCKKNNCDKNIKNN